MTGGLPEVSLIVISDNHGLFIRECVDSILAQEGAVAFDVVVMDDASSDGSIAVLENYTDRRLRIVRHAQKLGRAAMIAEGLALTRAPLIGCIDGDDRCRAKFLLEFTAVFEKNPAVILAYADAAAIDESSVLRHTSVSSYRPRGDSDRQIDALLPLLERSFIQMPSMVARRIGWQACFPAPPGPPLSDGYFAYQMARVGPCYYRGRVLAEYRTYTNDARISRLSDRTEERSTFRLLKWIYEQRESSPRLDRAKRSVRTRVYAARYLELATHYFGQRMDADARRCFLQALRRRPWWIVKPAVARRLIGTFIGHRAYRVLKRWWL